MSAAARPPIPVYSVRLVRESSEIADGPPAAIHNPTDVVRIVATYLEGADREHLVALMLNSKAHAIGIYTVAVGTLDAAPVHPREVFKAAILANAASVIVGHNHPSGDPTPSPQDIAVTRRLYQAGLILGIDLLDHVIVCEGGAWTSMEAANLLGR